MKLSEVFGLKGSSVIFIGKPEATNYMDSDNKPYYVAKLKSPITVRCSVDKEIEALEVDELYIRENDINQDGWKFANDTKPEEGFWMEGWVADYSKGQELPIYQATSIRQYIKELRGEKREDTRDTINKGIRARMEERRKK